jgi:hypothetical protein
MHLTLGFLLMYKCIRVGDGLGTNMLHIWVIMLHNPKLSGRKCGSDKQFMHRDVSFHQHYSAFRTLEFRLNNAFTFSLDYWTAQHTDYIYMKIYARLWKGNCLPRPRHRVGFIVQHETCEIPTTLSGHAILFWNFVSIRSISTHPKRPTRQTTNVKKNAHLIFPNAIMPNHHPTLVVNFFGLFLSIK